MDKDVAPLSANTATAALPAAPLPDDPAVLKQLLLQHQQRIAELELDNLLLNHRLAVALKQCYGPRADKVPLGQMLLEFAAHLEARPVVAEDLPPGTNLATVTRRVGTGEKGKKGRGIWPNVTTCRCSSMCPTCRKTSGSVRTVRSCGRRSGKR
jgi:hypothetical protein